MGKYANPGEFKTPIIVEAYTDEKTSNGYSDKVWKNVFGDGKTIRAKWVNVHGTEVFEAMGLDLKQPATLKTRYSPLITEECRIIRAADKGKEDQESLYYEVISIDDIDDAHVQLEIKVQREKNAK